MRLNGPNHAGKRTPATLADGSVVARYDTSPFGMTVLADDPAVAANPWRFSTKYHDTETSFVYYGYRYYSPELGRWINRDPIGEFGGRNLHQFVRNRPISMVDHFGLIPWYKPWVGSCHGRTFNRLTNCCCKGTVISKAKRVKTGVKMCVLRVGVGPEHMWVEIGPWSAGFYPPAPKPATGGAGVVYKGDAPAGDAHYYDKNKKCFEIEVSACAHSVKKFRELVKAYWRDLAADPPNYIYGLHDCRTEAILSIEHARTFGVGCTK